MDARDRTPAQPGQCGGLQHGDDLLRLVKQRQVAPEEAYLKAVDKQDMAVKLRTAGFHVG